MSVSKFRELLDSLKKKDELIELPPTNRLFITQRDKVKIHKYLNNEYTRGYKPKIVITMESLAIDPHDYA